MKLQLDPSLIARSCITPESQALADWYDAAYLMAAKHLA